MTLGKMTVILPLLKLEIFCLPESAIKIVNATDAQCVMIHFHFRLPQSDNI